MSAKAIVTKLKTLAADPANRTYIVKDQGCLPGLAVFMDDQDQDVVLLALEVIYFLSLETTNREVMAQQPGLLKGVRKLMATGKLKQKKVAIAAYTNLQAYADKSDEPSAPSTPNNTTTPTPIAAAPQTPTSTVAGKIRPGGIFFSDSVRTSISQAQTCTVYVTGLKDERAKKIIGDCLLTVKGVISFIIDTNEQKIVIRTVASPDVICQAVFSNTGMRASIGKEEEEEEEDDKENQRPNYLPEATQAGASNGRGWFGLRGAIVTMNDAKKEQKQEGNGWFSKIGKALSFI
eukprot:TRINITY_DN12639_c0_g1_i1.p1 TRINITY_DN12639_c0_g1~~TRINITY_DN12639_c0_g1_i1.p1  ORF type:complete len:291 (+),score=95.22 TRINITY_DN12639_c0_g1_i1:48-920(+)